MIEVNLSVLRPALSEQDGLQSPKVENLRNDLFSRFLILLKGMVSAMDSNVVFARSGGGDHRPKRFKKNKRKKGNTPRKGRNKREEQREQEKEREREDDDDDDNRRRN